MSPRIALIAVLLLLPGLAAAERHLVLVTGKDCPAEAVSMLDVRKAYLGIGVEIEGHPLRAFRLMAGGRIDEVFYQNVVAMSARSYERRMLSMTLKYGTPRPREFDSISTMVAEMVGTKCAIGYMWRQDVASYEGIKVVRLLWQGE